MSQAQPRLTLTRLIPHHITTQGELDAWEQHNIVQGRQWAFGRHSRLTRLQPFGKIRLVGHGVLGVQFKTA